MSLPTIAIVGRPNVGKSSLFNRFVGRDMAIVTDVPGTTRDRISATIRPKKKGQRPFELIDTAGVIRLIHDDAKEQELETRTQEQVRYALDNADILLFMVDGKADGFASTDYDVAELIRRSKKPVIFVVNKCDNKKIAQGAAFVYELGYEEPILLSVSHKQGFDELILRIQEEVAEFPEEEEEEETGRMTKFALVGTPNVGKSAIFNAMCGVEKALVSDVAGTTRDATDTTLEVDGTTYLAIDTAGIRKRGKIEKGIEKFSILRTKKSIAKADICLLVLDAKKGVTKQDQHVSEAVLAEGKGLIIIVNKWDLVKEYSDFPVELQAARIHANELMDQYVAYLRFKFPYLPWAPALFTSGLTGKNIKNIFPLLDEIMVERDKRVDTGKFNRFLERIIEKHKPTGAKAFIPKISYGTQIAVRPPTFAIVVNDKKFFHFSYARYIENKLREKYGFTGTPIRVELKNKRKKDYKGGK